MFEKYNLLYAIIIIIIGNLNLLCGSLEENHENPTSITGKILDTKGFPIQDAGIRLTTVANFETIFSKNDGSFNIMDFPSGKHRIKVIKLGFEEFEASIPNPVEGNSYMNIILSSKSYSIPENKPISKGRVRINNKFLEIDYSGSGIYQKYIIKGAAYSPTPINGSPIPSKIHDRGLNYLKQMNANTIRTYSGIDKYFLQKAAENNIFAIVGFWVNTGLDLSSAANRKSIINDFAKMVIDLKDFPAVLMWNIGNEQNYVNGNNVAWYSLVEELAITAYKIEGEKYHPVCANNGNIYNIGNPAFKADDASMVYTDLWATNIYEIDLSASLQNYKTKSSKPIVLTEWGIDALDNRNKIEYENIQGAFDSTNWMQIISNQDICLGGTVFEFTDEWWKDDKGKPLTQDFGGYPTSAHPDGYSNEEWWGIIAVGKDTDGDGLDEWRPRMVFYTLSRLWK